MRKKIRLEEIVKQISDKTGIPKKDIKLVLKECLKIVANSIFINFVDVEFRGFFTLHPYLRHGGIKKLTFNGDEKEINIPSKIVVSVRRGRKFK